MPNSYFSQDGTTPGASGPPSPQRFPGGSEFGAPFSLASESSNPNVGITSGRNPNRKIEIQQREKEVLGKLDQRVKAAEEKNRQLELELEKERDVVRAAQEELASEKQVLAKLKEDFNFNYQLLQERDAEFVRQDAEVAENREVINKRTSELHQFEAELQQQKLRTAELETELQQKTSDYESELHQQKMKVQELEVYCKELESRTEREVAAREVEARRGEEERSQREAKLHKELDRTKKKAQQNEQGKTEVERNYARKLQGLEEENARLAEALAGKSSEHSTYLEKVHAAEFALKAAETNLEAMTVAKEARIAELEAALRECQEDISRDRKETKGAYEKRMEEVRSEMEIAFETERQDHMSRLQQAVEEHRKDIGRYQKELAESKVELLQFESKLAEVTNPDYNRPRSVAEERRSRRGEEDEDEDADVQGGVGDHENGHHHQTGIQPTVVWDNHASAAAGALSRELMELRRQQELELELRDKRQARQTEKYFVALREDREAAALLVSEAEQRARRLEKEGAALKSLIHSSSSSSKHLHSHKGSKTESGKASRPRLVLESRSLDPSHGSRAEKGGHPRSQSQVLSEGPRSKEESKGEAAVMRDQLLNLQTELAQMKKLLPNALHDAEPVKSSVNAEGNRHASTSELEWLRIQLSAAHDELERGRARLASIHNLHPSIPSQELHAGIATQTQHQSYGDRFASKVSTTSRIGTSADRPISSNLDSFSSQPSAPLIIPPGAVYIPNNIPNGIPNVIPNNIQGYATGNQPSLDARPEWDSHTKGHRKGYNNKCMGEDSRGRRAWEGGPCATEEVDESSAVRRARSRVLAAKAQLERLSVAPSPDFFCQEQRGGRRTKQRNGMR